MEYVIVIEQTINGFSAYVPDLPGCITVGDTKEEVQKHIQEAMILHINGLKEDGFEIPIPSAETINVSVPNVT